MTLLCPTAPGKEPEGLDPRIRVVPVEDRRSRVRKLFALAAGRLHRYGTVFPEMLAKESYDLVFFDTVADSDLSDHSGLYIGNGKFIHASSSGKKVIISDLSKPGSYYNRVFSWGRRVLD